MLALLFVVGNLQSAGPKADGTIPEESVRIRETVGEWLAVNRDSLTTSERHPLG